MTSTLSPIVSNVFRKSNSLQIPTDIIYEQKYYYSTDKGSNSVTIYDKSLRKVSDFGEYGDGNNNFNEPISIDAFNERVFVADALNHRIQVFDLKGRYETSIQGTFLYPHCVRVNDYNQLIVVDNWKSKVELYDIKTGKLTGTIGNSCSNDSFHRPTHVVSRKNEIWVSDTGNGKIEHFIDGIYVNELKLDKIGIDNKPLGIDLMNDEIVVTFVNKNTDVCFISLNEFQ
ncbi:Nhl repeat-containing protein [Entamoeba marina]